MTEPSPEVHVSPATRSGRLVLVATPIGNLGDLSPRSVAALADADVIACEDTRRTGRLLAHADIRDKKLIIVNDHSERDSVGGVMKLLRAGITVAVVTDAGLPGISDPGQMLVAGAVDEGFDVLVIPGPSAGVTALVGSGIDTSRWVFEGFIPRKGSARSERLLELASERRTLVIYESPHRLERTVTDLANVFGGERRVAVARELTKLHEQYWRGTLDEAVAWAAETLKGEIVIVVEGAPKATEPTDEMIMEELRAAISQGETTRDAVAQVTTTLGVARNRTKDLAHKLND